MRYKILVIAYSPLNAWNRDESPRITTEVIEYNERDFAEAAYKALLENVGSGFMRAIRLWS